MNTRQSSVGNLPITGAASYTAGTTQTQAGATAASAFLSRVTTGNANDGVSLPRGDAPGHLNQTMIVVNKSAVALKVYPYYTSASTNDDGAAYGGTIDGGAANAAIT